MSDGLKPGWRRVKFGEVVHLNKDTSKNPEADGLDRYVGLEHLEPGDLRIRSWGDIADGTTFTNRFRPGHVLFGKRRAYQRKVAVADFDGICSGDIYVLESKDPSVLLPELLPFICQTDAFFEHAISTSAGSLSPRTNWKSLAEYKFVLPPLEEQRRIVKALFAAEKTLEAQHELIIRIENVRVSALTEWQSSWETDYGLHAVSDLLLAKPKNGFSPQANSSGTGYKTVSISAVRNGIFSPNDCIKHADVRRDEVINFFVRQDDIFVVRGNGNRQLTGQAGLARHDYDDTFYPDLLIRLRFDPTKIKPLLATEIWNSPVAHSRLIARAKSTNGIWKINGKDIQEHKIAIPPLKSQQEICLCIEQLIRERKAATDRLKATQELKREMLVRRSG